MAHGPDAVHELVSESGWSYPVSVRRLEREHALANVQLDEDGNSIMLAELLSETNVDRFESREDLEAKLGPVFESESQRRKVGFFGRIKRTFLGG
ncbi:hypothetical protein [Halopelagius longus]|uniref:Uncharacterized protein n=1 Tax=Halopelagius longus TaxID=1236180 RepID=A0A1H1FG23_9EURY|nr:hypothetical protein [Halopelagius longus]RDI70121.1 hypothetical protein DWB78_15975 [Halopelagius longus]SDQ99800.1 hypothetical protein SAMN05216278_3190 [Halopelagius longus]